MEAASGTLQLNVRIPRQSKETGDAVLSLMGSSPTKIVRALYDKISQGAKAYEEVVQVLAAAADSPGQQAETDPRLQAFERATHFMESFAKDNGLDLSTFVPMTDEEYEDALYEEYLEESRGYAYD